MHGVLANVIYNRKSFFYEDVVWASSVEHPELLTRVGFIEHESSLLRGCVPSGDTQFKSPYKLKLLISINIFLLL